MLARLAASSDNPKSADSEAAIEKYLRSVLAVENILTLDRLRQVRGQRSYSSDLMVLPLYSMYTEDRTHFEVCVYRRWRLRNTWQAKGRGTDAVSAPPVSTG